MVKLRTAIIGAGKGAQSHAEALSRIPESEFAAVYRRDRAKGRNFAEQYGVQCFTDVESMMSGSHIDVVCDCTPHPVHASGSVTAMQCGAHALIEKPLASSLEDCDLLIRTARECGVKLGMISQRRLYPPVQRIREAIENGKLGKPVLGTVQVFGWRDEAYYRADPWRGTWKLEGGGVLVNQTPHQLDILQWMMGPIDSLYGVWTNFNHPTIEVEDTSVAVLRFKNGAIGNIVVSNSQNPALFGKITVCGENGACTGVQTDGGAMFIAGVPSSVEAPYNDIWTIPGETSLKDGWRAEDEALFARINPMEYFHEIQIRDFLQAVIEDREPMVSGEEGRKTVEIFTAIYRSQRDGKPVYFPLMPEPDRDDFDGRSV